MNLTYTNENVGQTISRPDILTIALFLGCMQTIQAAVVVVLVRRLLKGFLVFHFLVFDISNFWYIW